MILKSRKAVVLGTLFIIIIVFGVFFLRLQPKNSETTNNEDNSNSNNTTPTATISSSTNINSTNSGTSTVTTPIDSSLNMETLLGSLNDSHLIASSENEILDLINIDPSDKENYVQYGKFAIKKKDKGIQIFSEGKRIDFSKYDKVQPILENGRTLLPLRAVTESLGAELEWDNATKSINISYLDKTLALQMNSKVAYVDESKIALDVPPKSVNGRTLVPIRFVSENFSKKVEWLSCSKDLKIVYIY